MKFGLLFSPHWPNGKSQAQVYDDVIGHFDHAEKLGFYSGWVTEHHFAADPNYKPFGINDVFPAYDVIVDPLTFLAHIASRTKKIRLGTGVLVMHYDDPIRVAERAAMLDVLSGGRVELGLGRGGGKKEPAAWNVPSDQVENQDKFFESIDVMLEMWKGEAFEHKGTYFQYPEVIGLPVPTQKQIPIYLSNRNIRSITYAAQKGLSYTAVSSAWGATGVDSHNSFHDQFVEIATEAGHDVSGYDYPQTLYCYMAPTDEEAIDMARACIRRRDGFAESHYESRRGGTASPLTVAHQGRPMTFDEQFEDQLTTNLIGSPKTVCEKFAALKERMPSMNYCMAIIGAGSGPVEFDRRSMELLATEVMPKFADA